MIFLFIIFAIILLLCGAFIFSKEFLVKIMIANGIYTAGIFFLCIYSFEIGYIEIFSLLDIALIYTLTSFIFNVSLIKFYKIIFNQNKNHKKNQEL
jgi:hypothetical protein